MTTNNLTEQWKKRELEDGFYYVKLVDGEDEKIIIDKYCNSFKGWEDSENWQISEVLAPVPSFEECKDLKLHDEKATIKLGEKIIENDKLKRLLEECKNLINECIRSDYKDELCERIDEVLK